MTNHRVLQSILAGLALVVLLVGVPGALLTWGRSPLDGSGSLWEQLRHLPTQTVSDHVAFGLLTVAAWIGWGLFAISVATEFAAALGVAARWDVPTPGPIQLWASRLVMSLMTGITLISPLSQRAGAVPALPTESTAISALAPSDDAGGAPEAVREPPVSVPVEDEALEERTAEPVFDASALSQAQGHDQVSGSTSTVAKTDTYPLVMVATGDTPWGLADRHLGHGLRWRDIWDLNQGVTQPDGRAWVEPDLIVTGWSLRLPHDATHLPDRPTPAREQPEDHPDEPPEISPDPLSDTEAGNPGRDQGGPRSEEEAQPAASPGLDETDTSTVEPSSRKPEDHDHDDSQSPQLGERDNPGSPDDGSGPPGEASGSTAPLASIAGATVLATGLVLYLQRVRRRQATKSARRQRRGRDARSRRAEQSILRAADVPLVRWAGQELADMVHRLDPSDMGGAAPVAVELSEDHGIELLWDQPVPKVVDPWIAIGQGWSWTLPYDPDAPVPDDEYPCPIPGLVTIGRRDGRQLMIDLEAFGPLAVTGDATRVAELGWAVGLELGANDDLADAYVSTVGFGLGADDHLRRLTSTTLNDACNRLRATADTVDRTLNELGMESTFEYRATDPGNYLEAVLVMAASSEDAHRLVPRTPSRRGVGTILLDPEHQSGTIACIQIASDGSARFQPLGIEFQATGLDAETVKEVTDLVDTEAGDHDNRHRSMSLDSADGPMADSTDPAAMSPVEAELSQLAPVGPPTGRNSSAPEPGGNRADLQGDATAVAHTDTDTWLDEVGATAQVEADSPAENSRVSGDQLDPGRDGRPNQDGPSAADAIVQDSSPSQTGGTGTLQTQQRVSESERSDTDATDLGAAHEEPIDGETSRGAADDADHSSVSGNGLLAQSHGRTPTPDQPVDDPLAGRMLVQVLGKPTVPDRPKLRRRAVILTVFLACRGKAVAADAMRHAVWNGRSRTDKTVWNLVAEARTALGAFDDGEPVIPASDKTTNTLNISDRVVTDLSLLRKWHEEAQDLPSGEAIQVLSQALSLIQGAPFAGAGYEWAHEEQDAIEAAIRIEDAALHLVELATETGQQDVARDAITAGLRGLPGNEPLYRARMHLEHDLGNNAGVHAAWNELTTILDELGTDPAEATATLYAQLTRS